MGSRKEVKPLYANIAFPCEKLPHNFFRNAEGEPDRMVRRTFYHRLPRQEPRKHKTTTTNLGSNRQRIFGFFHLPLQRNVANFSRGSSQDKGKKKFCLSNFPTCMSISMVMPQR